MSTYTEGFFVSIKRKYGLNCTLLLKRWSKLNEKLARTEAKKTFLIQCRKTKRYPRFLNDRTDHLMQSTMGTLSNKLKRRADAINTQVRARLLNFHISSVHSDIAFIHRQMSNIFIQLEPLLPSNILDQYETSLLKKYTFFLNNSLSHLQTKLNNLGSTPFSRLPFHDKWIKNLTNIQIPRNILKLLSLGPKFGLQPSFNDYSVCNFVADIENILSHSEANELLELRSSANNILTNFSHKPPYASSDIDDVYRQTSTFLKEHPDLMVLTSDKAQFLTDILSQAYNYKNEFNIVDSFQFSEFINNYQLPREYVLVSFDVVSLFSNLPLSSVVTSLRNHWNEIQPHSPVSWEIFSELLKLTFDTNYLIFNDKYYRQIFGTPMGSSTSPILVNFVLDDLINESITTKMPQIIDNKGTHYDTQEKVDAISRKMTATHRQNQDMSDARTRRQVKQEYNRIRRRNEFQIDEEDHTSPSEVAKIIRKLKGSRAP
ncbi:uncharacterized protein [Diabrotica undecimpunctata]|uniref:uncharacterized protein n=1 Tax=Diabrotica undecimpunctata TaxID=50387 RepID=UPI003B6356E3